ncbi:MAG: hypothetical protein Q9203_004431 [Teloschistes exilis]
MARPNRGRSTGNDLPFQSLLKDNDLAIIENPLRRIPEDHLKEHIDSFHTEAGLEDIVDKETLFRGARAARDPEAFIAGEIRAATLSKIDKAAFDNEKSSSLWTESREIQIIHLICFVGSIVQGMNGTAFGIAVSGAIALLVPNGWRFQIASSFIPAFALLLLVFVGSESPRWLIKKQRYAEAYTVLLRLRENTLLASRDLVLIWAQLQVETTLFTRTKEDVIDLENRVPYLDSRVYLREIGLFGYGRRITQLFTIPRARRATVASALVMLAQQLTGVNVFAFFASTLFGYGQKGSSRADISNLWLFFAFGVTNFLSSLLAYRYIDSKGRRWLLMFSLAAMFPLLLATAFSFKAQYHKGPVAVFLVLYTIIATMEEMNYVFGVSTWRHVEYQLCQVLPWSIDHYLLRKRGVDLEPLYRYNLSAGDSDDQDRSGDHDNGDGTPPEGLANGRA